MKFWNFIKNDAASEEDVELRITGEIIDDDWAWLYDWFDIPAASPNAFRQELKEHAGKNITVWIDSYGGSVMAGTGIYNALKEHKGKKTVKIDGKAMSAASVIAMAGDEVLMSPGSLLMIHNPWTGVAGEAKDMRHTADVLDEVKEAIINAYQIKTKRSRNKISEMMDNETFMSARTAISEGFADAMLYVENKETEPAAMNFSRLAIQNSLSMTMAKALEQLKVVKPEAFKDEPKPEPEPITEEPRQVPVNLYKLKLKNVERRMRL
jgi:ATP-dependent Clp protease protease subunit